MTPKEKAIELVDKFFDRALPDAVENDYHVGVRCALIAVDEILESREDDGAFDDTLLSTSSEYYTPHPMYLTYWLQVKQEIEKL